MVVVGAGIPNQWIGHIVATGHFDPVEVSDECVFIAQFQRQFGTAHQVAGIYGEVDTDVTGFIAIYPPNIVADVIYVASA